MSYLSSAKALAVALVVGLAACRSGGKSGGKSVAPAERSDHALYAIDGSETTLESFARGIADVDLVAFGELHEDPVGARYELDLLRAMAGQERPVALAMEFFEADTQGAIDAYLAGTLDEAEFRAQTGRDERYDASHRPLIELCKAQGIPVIAANAPRPLVTRYRKSGLEYADYLLSLGDDERELLPRSSVPPEDAFKRRFMELMGPKRGPSFYRSMALWNDAMAESIADFRAEHPEHRVLLVVGAFHVAAHLGTITQYTERRPDDSTKVVVMDVIDGDPRRFAESMKGEGDLILGVYGPRD